MVDPLTSNAPAPRAARARLTGFGVIRARGDDAARFLHGQLTQDVLQLPADAGRLAAFCSAKGRILSSFVMWKPAPDEVLLVCPSDGLAETLKRLSMFVLRAKCRLDDASQDFLLDGVWAPTGAECTDDLPATPWARTALPGGATAIRLPSPADGGLWLVARPVPADATTAAGADADLAAVAQLPEAEPEAFLARCIAAGLPWILHANREQFVPQMVNFELLGGVNFQKGCYPGQEVVARSQYRGTVKRRLLRFAVDGPATPGQELFHSADPGQPAGRVALAAPVGPAGEHELLAEVKLAALEGGSLHLGSPEGPTLRPQALPYALPAADAEVAATHGAPGAAG